MENYKIRTLNIDEKYGKTIIYYVATRDISFDEIVNRSYQDNEVIATAHVGWYFDSDQTNYEATIVGLNVEQQFQHLGIGSKLLGRIINDALHGGMDVVKVDDMTERYHDKHNIYVKFGFHYVDPTGGPEMVLKF
jgi:GNAT superfamily N-acetyltransferase